MRRWWCAPVTGLLVLASACGDGDARSEPPQLDKSLVKQVRAAFDSVEHADGSTTRLAIHLDTGTGKQKDVCMMARVEATSAAPPGGRSQIYFFGTSPEIDPSGYCYADNDARDAIVNGSTVYLPATGNRAGQTRGCKLVYQRNRIPKAVAAELRSYGDDATTSKIAKLLKVTRKISKHGRDVVLEMDPEKLAASNDSQLGSSGDLPDDATATMTVGFSSDGVVTGIDLVVGAGDFEMREHVLYQALGEVQHIAVPEKACVVPGTGTVDSTSEVLARIGLS